MSDCDVCLCSESDCYVQFFHQEVRTCRKPTKCFECGTAITKGQRYKVVGGKCEGEMWREKICLLCDEILRVFSCDGPIVYGYLWEGMHDCVFPELTMNSKCFRKLSPGAKQFVLDKWRKWKF